jgi:hypothetical protein
MPASSQCGFLKVLDSGLEPFIKGFPAGYMNINGRDCGLHEFPSRVIAKGIC